MATSVVPDLLDALFTQATAALPSVLVLYGTGDTNNPGDYLMVGVDDPEAVGLTQAANTQETPGPYSPNRPRDELGDIPMVAESWNGNSDLPAAVAAVHVTAAAVANLCRTSQGTALGVANVLWTSYNSTGGLQTAQGDRGAVARLSFRIAYRARL